MNSLALSTEYVLRTGAFDHTCKQYSSPEEMKKVTFHFVDAIFFKSNKVKIHSFILLLRQVALERYNKMKGSAPERLVSGSDDFTMFLWEPSVNKHPKTRMTGHQQVLFRLTLKITLKFTWPLKYFILCFTAGKSRLLFS